MAIYHRQQELAWIEDQVEHVEAALGEMGARARPERVPAMCFLDLAGYTRLTEERGRPGRRRAGRVAGGAGAPLGRRARWRAGQAAGRWGDALRSGTRRGAVVVQGGDYFGRTVNLAARIASRAAPGRSW
jgi:class 3 adenylate cyclase